jgi:hypothetical protein
MKRILTFMAISVAALAAAVSSSAGEPTCNAEPSCGAAPCCDQGRCCPKCGCHEGLVPVCHITCVPKKETKYHYCCKCEEICIPGPHGPKCAECGCENGSCANQGGCDQCGCGEENCHCKIREVHKLVKYPYTEQHPVRKCTVEWVCPRCGCGCGTTEGPSTTPAPGGAPAPAAPTPPPPAPKSAKATISDFFSMGAMAQR